jgi:hypothetical protein
MKGPDAIPCWEVRQQAQAQLIEQAMSAPFLRAEHPYGEQHAASSLRIVLITDEPLYRAGVQCAFQQAQSVILLDATTIADAVELAKSGLADLVVIESSALARPSRWRSA